jgi:hypothetical protein
MPTVLELVFKYRQLVGTCESGAGLSLDDIEVVSTIESLFAVNTEDTSSRRWRDRPLLGTESVNLSALMRGKKVCDRVGVIALGPEGMVCTRAPWVSEGDTLELIIDDAELDVSYRFMAQVIWAEDQFDDSMEVELRFTGTPVLVRYGETATRPASHGDDAPAPNTPKPQAMIVEQPMDLEAAVDLGLSTAAA